MKKLIVLLLFIPLVSFGQEDEFDFSNVERVPIYPGCEVDMKQLRNCFQEKIQVHIIRNFRYPEMAQRKKIQGSFNNCYFNRNILFNYKLQPYLHYKISTIY